MQKPLSRETRETIIQCNQKGWSAKEIAAKAKCSVSTVYRVLREKSMPETKSTTDDGSTFGIGMGVSLPGDQFVVLKVEDDKGRMLATLIVDQLGVQFKRPKQKIDSQRLSWELLDRLSTLGLTTNRSE